MRINQMQNKLNKIQKRENILGASLRIHDLISIRLFNLNILPLLYFFFHLLLFNHLYFFFFVSLHFHFVIVHLILHRWLFLLFYSFRLLIGLWQMHTRQSHDLYLNKTIYMFVFFFNFFIRLYAWTNGQQK